MSDKLRDLSPVNVNWSGGEQPTAAKLQGWSDQIANGFRKLEEVIGDPFSDSHPLFESGNTPIGGWAYDGSGNNIGTEQRHLQIINLARLIGPASVLNPRVLTNNTVPLTEEVLGGQNEFRTRYRPISNVVLSDSGAAGVFATLKGSRNDIFKFGDYYVDEASGQIFYIANQAGSVGTITYDVDLSAAKATDTYEDATFNVIPDPNQSTKCTVTGPSAGRYTIALPTATDQQTDWDELTTTLDSDEDPNYLQQLTLPTAWASEFTSGDEIPDGLVRIWDGTALSFLEGQVFYYVDQTSVQVNDAIAITTGSDRYSIVVQGTDITRLLDQLRTNFHKHEHTGSDGSKPIDHRHITGKARGYLAKGEIGGGPSVELGFSRDNTQINDNDHPQYLHRDGVDGSDLKNAMLGSILMSPVLYDDGTNGWAGSEKYFYDGAEGQDGTETFALFFGNNSARGARIRGEFHGSTDGVALTIDGQGGSDYVPSSVDGVVVTAKRRIAIDNTGQSTYDIELSSGDTLELTSNHTDPGIINTDVNDFGVRLNSVSSSTLVRADKKVRLRHGSGEEVSVYGLLDGLSTRAGGKLSVKGSTTYPGEAEVNGAVVVNAVGSVNPNDGEVNAQKGFCTPAFGGLGSAVWFSAVTNVSQASPGQYNFDISSLTNDASFSALYGFTVLLKENGDDRWYHPNAITGRNFYCIYDESQDRIEVQLIGTSWDSSNDTIDIRVVVTYAPQ